MRSSRRFTRTLVQRQGARPPPRRAAARVGPQLPSVSRPPPLKLPSKKWRNLTCPAVAPAKADVSRRSFRNRKIGAKSGRKIGAQNRGHKIGVRGHKIGVTGSQNRGHTKLGSGHTKLGSHTQNCTHKIGTKLGSDLYFVTKVTQTKLGSDLHKQNWGQIYTLLQCESGNETGSVPHFRMLPLSDTRRPAWAPIRTREFHGPLQRPEPAHKHGGRGGQDALYL